MKKVISLVMIVLLAAVLIVSCSNSPDPSPTPTPTDPTYTPTLTSYNAKEVFAKGVSEATAKEKGYFGSLRYQDAKGNIETISVKDSDAVKVSGFDTASETVDDEVRTLTFQYKGLSVSTKYKVYELQIPAVKGTFVIGKNKTVTLDTVKDPYTAVIKTYENYMCLYNNYFGDYPDGVTPETKTIEYKFIADTNRVKLVIDGYGYPDDGKGGLQGRVEASDILEPATGVEYITAESFGHSISTPDVVHDRWLAFQFVDTSGLPMEKNDYVWNFYLLTDTQKDKELPENPTFQITADKISFDNTGVYVDKKTDLKIPTYAQNFQAEPNRDSTYTEFKGLHVVSYADSESGWKGYSCTLLPKK